MSLDLSKLLNVERLAGGHIRCDCPACLDDGGGQNHKHLHIFPDGAYGCAVDKSPAHYSRIFALAGGASDGSTPDDFVPQVEVDRTWPRTVLDRLVKDHSYWVGRGISEETIAPFQGGVATEGQMKGRYVFPIFSGDDIVGFSGRALSKEMTVKWKHIGRSSRFIWGGFDADLSKRVVLVESIGDSLALREHGVPESRVLFGVSLSQVLLGDLITEDPEQIVTSTNRDIAAASKEAGQRGAERIKKVLDKFFNEERLVIALPPEGVKDFGEMSGNQIKMWLDGVNRACASTKS